MVNLYLQSLVAATALPLRVRARVFHDKVVICGLYPCEPATPGPLFYLHAQQIELHWLCNREGTKVIHLG